MSQPALVRTIAQRSDAKVGLNFIDVAPPPSPQGVQTKTLGIVGAWPWGPKGTTVRCQSFADFRASFYPTAFGAIDAGTYAAMRAFLGMTKIPGPFYATRISPTSVADVKRADTYTVTGGAWVGTAAYTGTIAAAITITWAAATDADATHRNLTIAIGTTYSVTYANVTTTTILTLGDPYITWTATSSPTVLPAAAVAFSSQVAGADGTALAADYVGTSSSNVGIRRFYTQTVDWLYVAECPSGLIDAVNTGLVAYGTNGGKDGGYVLSSVASQSVSAAITYAASYRDTLDKGRYVWPRVIVTDVFSSTFPTRTVDGNAAAACAYAGTDAWLSAEFGLSAPYLTAITDLETNDSADGTIDSLKAVGVNMFYLHPTLGTILAADVVTDITSGKTAGKRHRYGAYVNAYLASIVPYYQGKPLDVDLSGQTLGEYSGGLVGAIRAFLADEWAKAHLATVSGAAGYSVDPYGSNVQADIDAGVWTIALRIKLYGDIDVLIVTKQIGSTVVITTSG